MTETLTCPQCGKLFTVPPSHAVRRTTCSEACATLYQRKFNPSPEELRQLVWQKPLTILAQEFGVSDKAIAKRCKKLGIPTPGIGYWARVQAGKEPNPIPETTVDGRENL